MASLEEAYGHSFAKQHPMTSKKYNTPEPRNAEREGRVAPTPQHRSAGMLQKHSKRIDDLSGSLPIANTEDEMEANYGPARVPYPQHSTQEKMTNQTRPKFTSPYTGTFAHSGHEFPYAPPEFQTSSKLDRILRMIEQNKTGYAPSSTHDLMLYIFTGVFFLYTLDTFVNLGKRLR